MPLFLSDTRFFTPHNQHLRLPSTGSGPPPGPPTPPGSPDVWFDGQDINLANNVGISDTDPIAMWKDKGSNGAGGDVKQASGPTQPTFVLADAILGKSALAFNGSQYIGDNSDQSPIGVGQPFTLAIACKTNVVGATFQSFFDTSQTSAETTLYIVSTNFNLYAGAPNFAPLGADTNWNLFIITFDGANTVVNFNGTDYPGTTGTDWFTNGIIIGTLFNGTHSLNGRIAEILIYSSTPSVAAIRAYFDTKYGATWPKV